MSILERFQHSDTFFLMSFGEKTAATGYVILLGMGITFVALILIWAATVLMSRVVRKIESPRVKAGAQAASGTMAAAPAAAKSPAVEEGEDENLVAVLTAAAAACMNTSVHNIVVSGIRRVEDYTPTWGKAGRIRAVNSGLAR